MSGVRGRVVGAVGAVVVGLVSGCGGSVSPPPSPAAGPADGGGELTACTIVPAAAVQGLIGELQGDPEDTSVYGESRCEFRGSGGVSLVVGYAPKRAFQNFLGIGATPVSGIGEQAAEHTVLGSIYSLAAVNGENYLQLTLDGETPVTDADKAAVRSVLVEGLKSVT